MTPHQIALVQLSFARIVPMQGQAGFLFYGRLFCIDPSTRPLFPDDMTAQSAKLMAVIAVVVRGLDDIGGILGAVRALAVRHVVYGVREAHYATVGAALLWTLEQCLGEDFTDEVRDAWAAAYALLSGAMIDAAHGEMALPR